MTPAAQERSGGGRIERSLRYGAAVALAVAPLVVLLVGAPSALADALTPESDSGSPNAEAIDTLYKITLYAGLVIFLLVEGLLIYSLVKFRARRGGPPAAQIRGNTPLEVSWTVGAALILVVLTVVTFTFLDDIENPAASGPGGLAEAEPASFASIDQPSPPGGQALVIGVNSQQYLFRYDYPGARQLFSYYELVVPVDTTVVLKVTSSDVVHAWWVPKLGGKVDAVPGHVNETWFKIPRPGTFYGQCAELCGANHADMRTRVRAVPVSEFERWAERKRNEIRRAGRALSRARVDRERP